MANPEKKVSLNSQASFISTQQSVANEGNDNDAALAVPEKKMAHLHHVRRRKSVNVHNFDAGNLRNLDLHSGKTSHSSGSPDAETDSDDRTPPGSTLTQAVIDPALKLTSKNGSLGSGGSHASHPESPPVVSVFTGDVTSALTSATGLTTEAKVAVPAAKGTLIETGKGDQANKSTPKVAIRKPLIKKPAKAKDSSSDEDETSSDESSSEDDGQANTNYKNQMFMNKGFPQMPQMFQQQMFQQQMYQQQMYQQQMYQQSQQQQPQLAKVGMTPFQSMAFDAPNVCLPRECSSDEDGDCEDGLDDGVEFSYKPQPKGRTEVTFTVEPKKQPWLTMMQFGFRPVVNCTAPPCYLSPNNNPGINICGKNGASIVKNAYTQPLPTLNNIVNSFGKKPDTSSSRASSGSRKQTPKATAKNVKKSVTSEIKKAVAAVASKKLSKSDSGSLPSFSSHSS